MWESSEYGRIQIATRCLLWSSVSLRLTAAVLSSLVIGSTLYATSIFTPPQETIGTSSAVAATENLNKGVQAFKEKQFDAAIDYFKKAVESDPNLTDGNLY